MTILLLSSEYNSDLYMWKIVFIYAEKKIKNHWNNTFSESSSLNMLLWLFKKACSVFSEVGTTRGRLLLSHLCGWKTGSPKLFAHLWITSYMICITSYNCTLSAKTALQKLYFQKSEIIFYFDLKSCLICFEFKLYYTDYAGMHILSSCQFCL